MADDKDKFKNVLFCVCCFATETDGSWGEVVIGTPASTHCMNCGAGGSGFLMPSWAVEEIRRNASFVGSRYYPSDEDKEKYKELQDLRATIKEFPGRYAERASNEPDLWWVYQRINGKTRAVTIKANSADEAMELTKLQLPYVPPITWKVTKLS